MANRRDIENARKNRLEIVKAATNDEEEDVRRLFLHMGRSFSDIRFRLRPQLRRTCVQPS